MTRDAYELRHALMTEGTNAGRNVEKKKKERKNVRNGRNVNELPGKSGHLAESQAVK